jgi:hypothetical protein
MTNSEPGRNGDEDLTEVKFELPSDQSDPVLRPSRGFLGTLTKRLKAAMFLCSRRTIGKLTLRNLLPCLAKVFSLTALIALLAMNPNLIPSILSEISLEDPSSI